MSREQITFRPPLEIATQIQDRADTAGISVNEWLNRAITYALASKTTDYTITVTTKVTF